MTDRQRLQVELQRRVAGASGIAHATWATCVDVPPDPRAPLSGDGDAGHDQHRRLRPAAPRATPPTSSCRRRHPPPNGLPISRKWGSTDPCPCNTFTFLAAAAQGDFGVSLRTGAPATEIVFDRLGRTLRLATAGLAVALVISIPLGVLGAVYRGRAWTASVWSSSPRQSVPVFWLGIVPDPCLRRLATRPPTSGVGDRRHYVTPSFVLWLEHQRRHRPLSRSFDARLCWAAVHQA